MCGKDTDRAYSEQTSMVQRFQLQDTVLGRFVSTSSGTIMTRSKN